MDSYPGKENRQRPELLECADQKEKFADARSLEAWLTEQGVTGYAGQLLVMERFGYPDFVTASADNLLTRNMRTDCTFDPSTRQLSKPRAISASV